jgi:CRP/FNR family transcriptional regulator, cyclic AMP receptor protein
VATSTKIDHLHAVPLFADCTKREFQQIAQAVDEVTVTAGTVLVEEGRKGREAFVIVRGRVTISRDGRKVATAGPGEIVGELSLLDNGPRTATAVCETDCDLIALDHRHFRSVLESSPAITSKLLAVLARRVRDHDRRTYG